MQVTVSCSEATGRYCSPAIIPANFTASEISAARNHPLIHQMQHNIIEQNSPYTKNSISQLNKQSIPLDGKSDSSKQSNTGINYFRSSMSSGKENDNSIKHYSSSNKKNAFFDHFDDKMKNRLQASSSPYINGNNINHIKNDTPEYEYDYEYEYEDDSQNISDSIEPDYNSTTSKLFSTIPSEISTDSLDENTRPSRNANHLRGASAYSNSVNPIGFQNYSPRPSYYRPGLGFNARPNVSPGTSGYISSQTPVYDMRTQNYNKKPININHLHHTSSYPPIPHPRPSSLPFGFHPRPGPIYPIPSHLSGTRTRIYPRPSANSFASHPQLIAHVNSLNNNNEGIRSHSNSVESRNPYYSNENSNENRHRPSSNNPFNNNRPFTIQNSNDLRKVYPSVNLGIIHRNPIASGIYHNSNIYSSSPNPLINNRNPYLTQGNFHQDNDRNRPIQENSIGPIRPFSTSQSAIDSHESNRRPITNSFSNSRNPYRPISSTSSFPNSNERFPANRIPTVFSSENSRNPNLSPTISSVSNLRRPLSTTIIRTRPRPTTFPPSLVTPTSNRFPNIPVVTTSSRPFGIPINPTSHFLSGHPIGDDRRRPTSNHDRRVPGTELFVDSDRDSKPAIRFPNRESAGDSRYKPISSTTASPLSRFPTTIDKPESFDRRPLSRRQRPASHSLRENFRQGSFQSSRNRIPAPSSNLNVNSVRGNSFISSTPTSGGFSTTHRSPLYEDLSDDSSEYYYYDDDDSQDYYADYEDEKKSSIGRPTSVISNSKPSEDYYYDYDYSEKIVKPTRNKNIKPTRKPSFVSSTEVNNILPSFVNTPRIPVSTQLIVTTQRPLHPKRPRFPTRQRVRTTTIDPNLNHFDDATVSTLSSPVTTGRTKSRVTHKTRLNVRDRFKSRSRLRTTTERSATTSTKKSTGLINVTTRRPQTSPSGRVSNSDRIAALRNRLRLRNKRVRENTEISENSNTHVEEQNKKSLHIDDSADDIDASKNADIKEENHLEVDTEAISEDDAPIIRSGSPRKRPIDPKIRARFRKFLENRKKNRDKLKPGNRGKQLLSFLQSENSKTRNVNYTDAIDGSGDETDVREFDKNNSNRLNDAENYMKNINARRPPLQMMDTKLDNRKSHVIGDERKSNTNHNTPSSRTEFETPSASSFVEITTTKYNNVQPRISPNEGYNMQNDGSYLQDKNEIYENQESQIVSKISSRGRLYKSRTTAAVNDATHATTPSTNTIVHQMNEIGQEKPSFVNYSLSSEVSKTTYIATAPPTNTGTLPTEHFRITDATLSHLDVVEHTVASTLSSDTGDHLDKTMLQTSTKPNNEILLVKNEVQAKVPHRLAKPVFNFDRKILHPSIEDHYISASDYSGDVQDISPVSLVPFTMSTDPPLLPLQKLLPLHK